MSVTLAVETDSGTMGKRQLGGCRDGVREAVAQRVGFTCCTCVGKRDSWLFLDSTTTKMSSFLQKCPWARAAITDLYLVTYQSQLTNRSQMNSKLGRDISSLLRLLWPAF